MSSSVNDLGIDLPDFEQIIDTAGDFVASAKSLIDEISSFKIKTEHEVLLSIKPPPAKSLIPTLFVTSLAVIGTVFAVTWVVRRPKTHKPRF